MSTIVLSGGGSGGHITPLLAVADELKHQQPNSKIVYIGQTGDKLGDIPSKSPSIDEVMTVRAGKFRRYHGESVARQLLDIPTVLKNIRDFFYLIIGIWQSWRLLRELRPDVIFIKGGFVGVPVGLAAAMLKIPYITHDSDSIPGLANRIISRWATKHAVALPADNYNYPAQKTVMTGIPLRKGFEPVTDKLLAKYRQELKLPLDAKVLFIIGGGLGSQTVNNAVAEAVPHLLNEFSDLVVIHAAGRANLEDVRAIYNRGLTDKEQGRLHLYDYLDEIYQYSGAADVIITRAGATNLAEFALQGKACVIIPSPFLTGGHQLKNAQIMADKNAAIVISETELAEDPNRLAKQVSDLLTDKKRRAQLSAGLSEFAVDHADRKLAQLILDQIKHETKT